MTAKAPKMPRGFEYRGCTDLAEVDPLGLADVVRCKACGCGVRYMHEIRDQRKRKSFIVCSHCLRCCHDLDFYSLPRSEQGERFPDLHAWHETRNGNEAVKVFGWTVTVFENKFRPGRYSYSISDGDQPVYSTTTFDTIDEAKAGAWEQLLEELD